MHMLRRFLAAMALTLFLSTPAWATYPLASDISGVVVDANQKPIQGATVYIHHSETNRLMVRTTNSKGRYWAKALRVDGLYRVTVVSHEGSVTFRPDKVVMGKKMRRNAVLGVDATNPPPFMGAWQWRQAEDLVQPFQPLGDQS